MKSKNKIYYWSPHLVNIATPRAVVNSAYSVKRYSSYFDTFIVNFFGEFNFFKDELEKIKIKLINHYRFNFLKYLPKYGKLKSRFSFFIIFIFSIFPLKRLLEKDKPDFLIIHLVTSLPLFLLIIFNFETKFILRISGLPNMNFFRKFFWKIALKKIYAVTCPTISTCDYIKSLEIVDSKKVKLLYDPIINVKQTNYKKRIKSDIINKYTNYFCAVGRLTKQKNFIFLCKAFNKFLKFSPDNTLLIAGEGEQKEIIQRYIIKNSLEKKIILLGHLKNIFPLLSNSKAFILSSLWEDPGFVILEAAFCKVPILSSNCPNGPKEIIKHNYNGFLYDSNDLDSFVSETIKFEKNFADNKKILLNNLKICKQFTIFDHFKSINKILMGD